MGLSVVVDPKYQAVPQRPQHEITGEILLGGHSDLALRLLRHNRPHYRGISLPLGIKPIGIVIFGHCIGEMGRGGPTVRQTRSEERRVGNEWVSTCRSRWVAEQ